MSLNLGMAAGARKGLAMPSAAARHRSAGASFIACSGGLVSASANDRAFRPGRGLQADKLSKDAYASALQEQIAARKAQNAVAHDVPAAPLFDEANKSPAPERLMGQRYGGPMVKAPKDDYASDLRAQIEARNAQRHEDNAARNKKAFGSDAKEGFFVGAVEAPALGARRRHGMPPLPTKDSYAVDLHRQMAMRAEQKFNDDQNQRDEPVDQADLDALDEMLLKGRRHGGPVVPTKSDYANELLQQMAVNKKQALMSEVDAAMPSRGGHAAAFSEQREFAMGKKVGIPEVSRSSYNTDLQKQMAERAAKRAADAHHCQPRIQPDGAFAAIGQEDTPRGGRRLCKELPETSKESYAQFLHQQIEQRKAQQQVQQGGAAQAAFIGGAAMDNGPLRGRRHADNMAPMSKKDYRVDLQNMMADREGQKHAAKFVNAGMRGDSLERLMGANAEHISCGEAFFGH